MSGGMEDTGKLFKAENMGRYCPICKKNLKQGEMIYNMRSSSLICMRCSNKIVENDPVEHPKHYTIHPSGIECIDITRHMNFNLGNVIKYIWRAGEKGNVIEDLKKAQWYLNDEIKRLEGEKK